jgi:hypothetical protein
MLTNQFASERFVGVLSFAFFACRLGKLVEAEDNMNSQFVDVTFTDRTGKTSRVSDNVVLL